MKGRIDESGRALLSVEIQSNTASDSVAIEVWVDTGFTGDLVLPKEAVERLSLRHSGSVDAILADGSQIELKTYHMLCQLVWQQPSPGSRCE